MSGSTVIDWARGRINKRYFRTSLKDKLHLITFRKDANATKEGRKNKAAEELKLHANITQEEIQQKAKEGSRTR